MWTRLHIKSRSWEPQREWEVYDQTKKAEKPKQIIILPCHFPPRPRSWPYSKPLLGRHLPRMGGRAGGLARWLFLRGVWKAANWWRIKRFLWSFSLEMFQRGNAWRHEHAVIALINSHKGSNQQRLVINVTKLQFKKVSPALWTQRSIVFLLMILMTERSLHGACRVFSPADEQLQWDFAV